MQALEPANVGGGKRSNGHKGTCKCPICKNMMKKKSGGNKYLELKKTNSTGTSSVVKGGSKIQALEPASIGGGKRSNGHKTTCKCPICVNMKHQQVSKKNRRVTRGKRTRRGGDKDDDDDTNDDDTDKDIDDVDTDTNDDTDSKKPPSITGGRKKRKGKGNGHKLTCTCPICKNMRKSGTKKGGVKSPYDPEKPKETTTEQIDNMEKGLPTPAGEGAQQNVGGSRRRRSRKSRKTRRRR